MPFEYNEVFRASGDSHDNSSLKCAIHSSTVEIGADAVSGGGVRVPLRFTDPVFDVGDNAGEADKDRAGVKAREEAGFGLPMIGIVFKERIVPKVEVMRERE